jgi:hypothetical protein
VIREEEVAWCRSSLQNLTVADLGTGIHFLPEDHAESIGLAVASWLIAEGLSRGNAASH